MPTTTTGIASKSYKITFEMRQLKPRISGDAQKKKKEEICRNKGILTDRRVNQNR